MSNKHRGMLNKKSQDKSSSKDYSPKNHINLKIIEPIDESVSSKKPTKASNSNKSGNKKRVHYEN